MDQGQVTAQRRVVGQLSDDGDYLVGSGEGLGAWRAIGSDLVQVLAYPVVTDGDAWAALLESAW